MRITSVWNAINIRGVCAPRSFLLAARFAALLVPSAALATPAITENPATGHPKISVKVTGSGFGANEAVDIYFDTTDMVLAVTDGSGNFPAYYLNVPPDALPGAHWVTAVGRRDGDATQKSFTVRTNWTEFGYDEHERRRNPYENVITPRNVDDLSLLWSVNLGSPVYSSPAVVGGVVYAGAADGHLNAYTASNGALKWSALAGSNNQSSPAVSGTTVYIGGGDGKLYAFNTSNGAFKWSATTGGPLYSCPAVANGIVYIGSQDHNVYAFDAATGAQKWSVPTGNVIWASPAVANGTVYVGSYDGRLYALDANTGALKWKYLIGAGGSLYASPTIVGSKVYVTATDFSGSGLTEIDAVDAETGAFVGPAIVINAAIELSPAIANGILYVGALNDQTFYAFDANTGDPLWSKVLGVQVPASPSAANGLVFIGSYDGKLFAFDETGALKWSTRTGEAIFSSAAISDGVVYIGSNSGRLRAYALDGGSNAAYAPRTVPPSFASLHPDYRLRPSF